jgi:hypothetical protein
LTKRVATLTQPKPRARKEKYLSPSRLRTWRRLFPEKPKTWVLPKIGRVIFEEFDRHLALEDA